MLRFILVLYNFHRNRVLPVIFISNAGIRNVERKGESESQKVEIKCHWCSEFSAWSQRSSWGCHLDKCSQLQHCCPVLTGTRLCLCFWRCKWEFFPLCVSVCAWGCFCLILEIILQSYKNKGSLRASVAPWRIFNIHGIFLLCKGFLYSAKGL